MESRTKFYGSILAMIALTAVHAGGIPLPDSRSEPITWRTVSAVWEDWGWQPWTGQL